MAGSDPLVDAARAVREHAVADYSRFKVGAALETADGPIITGCNIENATYGLTMCAERVAMFKALSEGHRAFRRVAVVADTASPDAAVRRMPADSLGVRRRHRGRAGEPGGHHGHASLERRCFPIRSTGGSYVEAWSTVSGRTVCGNTPRRCCTPNHTPHRAIRTAPGTEHSEHRTVQSSVMLPTIAWKDDAIVMVDQRKLPSAEVYVQCKSANEVAKAIKTMVIRGAPAIGVAAAMGIALGMERSKATGTRQFAAEFQKTCDLMAATRPTAVNLFWAIERMKRSFSEGALAGESVEQLQQRLRREAHAIHDEDVASCRAIGAYGAALVPSEARILTHCNAGALATAGYGTALGVIRGAVEAGKQVRVLADETRPFLQGSRLTAWELTRDGIDTTVITDSMAGALMRDGDIDLVVVGADRIAANGDTANKIGTYTVAVLAKEHGIPFYVASPWSTIDVSTPDGLTIPIEERHAREVTHVGANRVRRGGRYACAIPHST